MNTQLKHSQSSISFLFILTLAVILSACSSSTTTNNPPSTPTVTTHFAQTNMVSDTASFNPTQPIDKNLINPWGLVMGTSGHPWISDNNSGMSSFGDTSGKGFEEIGVPLPNGQPGGHPSGIVGAFGGQIFVFSTEDGTIAGWSGAGNATILSDSSESNAVFKGLAIVSSMNQIYATDFHNNAIVVYNTSFKAIQAFTDPSIPAGYGPFGIQNINDTLYVTYARLDYQGMDDSAGTSIGYVDRFTPAGTLIGRFVSGGNLNSPWGIAEAPDSLGEFANAILIGNFGDGKITGYTSSGTVIGQMTDANSNVISIPGLWAISFNAEAKADPTKLYFTAGPDGENHGIFGYLLKLP